MKNYFISKNLLEHNACKTILSKGEGVVNEIAPNGSLCIYYCAPHITKAELEVFRYGSPKVHHYERYGMSALVFSGIFPVECVINPSYYTDNRYELFKKKEELEIVCYLCDTASCEIVDAKVLFLNGAKLEKVKNGIDLNGAYSRRDYENWIVNVLYANDYKTNLKLSTYIGNCETSPNTSMLLI